MYLPYTRTISSTVLNARLKRYYETQVLGEPTDQAGGHRHAGDT